MRNTISDIIAELHPVGCGTDHRCPTDLHTPMSISGRTTDTPRGETHTPGFLMTTVYPDQETAEFEIEHEGWV